jgi:hypothetical protein
MKEVKLKAVLLSGDAARQYRLVYRTSQQSLVLVKGPSYNNSPPLRTKHILLNESKAKYSKNQTRGNWQQKSKIITENHSVNEHIGNHTSKTLIFTVYIYIYIYISAYMYADLLNVV